MWCSASDRPDARRVELFRSVFEPSSLDDVAVAVSVASADERRVYVERVLGGYRWSLTHPGGGYPLLHIAARFLRVEYTSLMLGFRSVNDGVCVVCDDPSKPTIPESWAVVEFDGATSPKAVAERIRLALASTP